MVSGCTCGDEFKIGSGFGFVVSINTSHAGITFMQAYCGEIGAYYGTYKWGGGYLANNTSPGGVITLTSTSGMNGSNGPWVKSSDNVSGYNKTIESCSFCKFSHTFSGNGSVFDTPSGSARKYNEQYRKAGDGTVVTARAASGYKLKKLFVNGSTVNTSHSHGSQDWTYEISDIQQDYAIVAYFVHAAYSATCNVPSGGTVTATKNGVAVAGFPAQPITGLQPDDVIAVTCTPNADKMVQNFVVDGYVTAGGSTGPQTFTFTVYEREDDAVYNCTVAFSDRTAVTDSVVGISGATFDPESETPTVPIDDATVKCNNVEVSRGDNGAFMAYVGNTYIATAHEPTIFRTYNGWVNGNGELVSAADAYGWTQGAQAVAITASYTDKPLYTENFLIGTSTRDAGTTSGTAYIAGCRADIARPSGESKVVGTETKYLGGTRTVTAHGAASASAPLPTGWSFVGVYVSDTDASGGTKLYKANGASAVTFDCACNANIYALFQNGAAVSPSDVDQGDSQIATGTAANGLYEWEGGASSMTMRYHSKRFVASMPMTLSTARVYADGYATGGTNDVKLKTLAFQSPDSTDAKAVDTTAKSQDAYRLPMRRPEKYVEMVVTAPHQVTQIAVATSMESLWQA